MEGHFFSCISIKTGKNFKNRAICKITIKRIITFKISNIAMVLTIYTNGIKGNSNTQELKNSLGYFAHVAPIIVL